MNKLLVAASILVLSTGLVFAEHGEGDGPHGGGMKKMLEELSLTPEQKESLKQLHGDKEEKKEDYKEKKEKFHQFMDSMFDAKNSEADLRKKFNELEAEKAKFAKERFEKMLKLRTILTPEQLTTLHTKMKEKREKMKGFFGRR